MMIHNFNFASIPHLIFGAGKLNELSNIIPNFGKNVLFVIGGSSLKRSGTWDEIISNMKRSSIEYSSVSVDNEPSPEIVDTIAANYRNKNIDLVIGIGGGSVTDAGKAISAMIPKKDTIKNYLEGIGTKVHDGEKIPFIAIPTTSGTGSEATKNAVISERGSEGFKKSLRHDNLIPNIAIIDPELMISCPPSVTAACGMDAFTQLLEAYVSTNASPMTDALAYSGMKYMSKNMISACTTGVSDINVRAAMAYGSLMSGITLANAGLGIVHGLASPIGGFFDIPHGVVCGTLLAEATKINIKKLKELGPAGKKGLKKHTQIGALLSQEKFIGENEIDKYCSILIDTLNKWTTELNIERLGRYGITTGDVEKIVKNAGLKNNPVNLTKEDIKTLVMNRL
ncbi:MAG: iron-containing alcohol dehydrogenase [Promethearchaeota archaeon]|nr:MAG: iron-containing alcohol dehydrogenase [Candidatus Lokiarchaeota archaeon]